MSDASNAPAPPAIDPLLQPGLRLAARYELVRALGGGAVGALWLAQDLRTGGEVAVKVLHPQHLGDRDLRTRFETEARTAAALVHPCIIEVLGAGQLADGRPYLVTEYVAGTTLERVAQGMPLRPRQAIPIAVSIAEGLARAHDVGIVHRDLKPSNVLVSMSRSGAPLIKISDFGLARPAGTSASGAALVGTPRYMAPELFATGEYTPRTDLYSLGCLLFELLTATPCLAVERFELVPAALAQRGPIDLAARVPECPPALAALVASLLAHDPALRPLDAHAVARTLRELDEPPPAPAPASDPARRAARAPSLPRIEPPSMPAAPGSLEARAAFAKTTMLPQHAPPAAPEPAPAPAPAVREEDRPTPVPPPREPPPLVRVPTPPAMPAGAPAPRVVAAPLRVGELDASRVVWSALEADLAALCEQLARDPAAVAPRGPCEQALRALRDASPTRAALASQRASLDGELRSLDAELRRDRERTGLDAAALGAELSQTRARAAQLAAAEAASRPGAEDARAALVDACKELAEGPGFEPSEALVEALELAARCAQRWRGLALEHDALRGAYEAADAHTTALEARLAALRRYHQQHEAHLATLRAQLEAEHAAVDQEARALDERLRSALRLALWELRGLERYAAPSSALEARLAAATAS